MARTNSIKVSVEEIDQETASAFAALDYAAEIIAREAEWLSGMGGDHDYDGAMGHVLRRVMELSGDPCSPEVRVAYCDEASHSAPPREKNRKPLSPRKSLAVFGKDGYKCVWCGTGNNLTVDHIQPVSKGGGNEPENLQTLCQSCNSKKGVR